MSVQIIHGDSRAALEFMPSNSIDSVVTDPPYALVSIGKRFGKDGAAPAKVGATGAYARASAGFMGKTWDTGETAFDPQFWADVLRVLKPGGHVLAFGGTRTYHRLACAIEDAGFEIRDQIGWLYGSGFPKSHNQSGEWEGWGTALKPAWEPIVVARKAIDGTVASNLALWGVGALNIDGCRVPFAGEDDEAESKTKNQHGAFGSGPMTNQIFGKFTKDRDDYNPPGRWPANVVHSGEPDVLEALGSPSRFFYCAKASRADRNHGLEGFEAKPLHWSSGDANPGSFQSANTDKSAKNNHPTVKPTELMRYLTRLVTPPGGTVLDPFMGSGSTGRGAVMEGFSFIGCELDADYTAIARARIAAVQPQDEGVFA
ncbi:Adenine-specific methyltransferase [Devosia sp. H5989]|nr:Adenine-specific methyltransferase [Devosia sp. H5989]